MAQRFPKWMTAGPFAALLVVFVFLLGYVAIGAAANFFGLQPTSAADDVASADSKPSNESAASLSARQNATGNELADPATDCDGWLDNPYLAELGYHPADNVALANLEPLVPSAAPRAWTVNAFGDACAGTNLWRAIVDVPGGQNGPLRVTLPAAEGVSFEMPDGRYVMLNPVMNGHYASASFLGSFVSEDGRPTSPPVLMSTGQNRGFHGRLYTPRDQPLGVFHVWLDAGGTWQGHTITWVGVTDFAGSTPRDAGAFLSSYSCPEGECVAFELTSVRYSENGPDEVTLTWSLDDGTSMTATYVLRAGQYTLQSGRAPEL